MAPAATDGSGERAVRLFAPLLIDSAGGRIYARAQAKASGQEGIAVLAASDGRLLATYDVAGPPALDATHGRLYVDLGDGGLAVLEAATGALLRTIPLPPILEGMREPPAPLADPPTGRVLAIRGATVYVVDAGQGRIERAIEFDLHPEDDCRLPHDSPLPIAGARYDSDHRLLYLDFTTYVCVPWVGYTVVSYDMAAGVEIARRATDPFQAVALDGRLYGTSWHRFGIGTVWAWHDGRPLSESTDWGGPTSGSLQVDRDRGWVYQPVGDSLRVLDAESMHLVMLARLPAHGQLAGFDPATRQLYFLSDGELWLWPVSDIKPAQATPATTELPADPVHLLAVSENPDPAEPPILYGVWGHEMPEGDCYVFDQPGGRLYASDDGGRRWRRLLAGLPGCTRVTALGVSTGHSRGDTLLAGIAGLGVFESRGVGGWRPTGAGLASMGVRQLFLSPAFVRDQTTFALLRSGGLHRSTDGGVSWQGLGVEPYTLALSPEFDQDRTLVGAFSTPDGEATLLAISRDGGENWEDLRLPGRERLLGLSVAPLFAKWQVLFAYGSIGTLYRSTDSGGSWQPVLVSGLQGTNGAQIVYAPEPEANRPVFVLATAPDPATGPGELQGKLFRSQDGGQSWDELEMRGESPTALAISPGFARDGLIFVGSAQGHVLALEGLKLPARR